MLATEFKSDRADHRVSKWSRSTGEANIKLAIRSRGRIAIGSGPEASVHVLADLLASAKLDSVAASFQERSPSPVPA
jgi:hypothetical protein